MLYSLFIAGMLVGNMDKFECYDRVHVLGADLTNESYTIAYDAETRTTQLFMDSESITAACIVATDTAS